MCGRYGPLHELGAVGRMVGRTKSSLELPMRDFQPVILAAAELGRITGELFRSEGPSRDIIYNLFFLASPMKVKLSMMLLARHGSYKLYSQPSDLDPRR